MQGAHADRLPSLTEFSKKGQGGELGSWGVRQLSPTACGLTRFNKKGQGELGELGSSPAFPRAGRASP